MAGAEVLYTPPVLALAASLAQWPWNSALPLQGTARSKSCGSALTLGLGLDAAGCIAAIGIKAQACAIGQAAAAIFANAATGKRSGEIAAAGDEIRAWLQGDAPRPQWPGLELIEPARTYPARHGAIMLAWQAARELLPTGDLRR